MEQYEVTIEGNKLVMAYVPEEGIWQGQILSEDDPVTIEAATLPLLFITLMDTLSERLYSFYTGAAYD